MDGPRFMTSPLHPTSSSREQVVETDWLASTPIFYDLKRAVVSSKIQEITPAADSLKFHSEGLYNFLDFGYSVFEQTPIEDVRFLRHSSRIFRENSGRLAVEYLPDPFDRYVDWKISESDLIELIRELFKLGRHHYLRIKKLYYLSAVVLIRDFFFGACAILLVCSLTPTEFRRIRTDRLRWCKQKHWRIGSEFGGNGFHLATFIIISMTGTRNLDFLRMLMVCITSSFTPKFASD